MLKLTVSAFSLFVIVNLFAMKIDQSTYDQNYDDTDISFGDASEYPSADEYSYYNNEDLRLHKNIWKVAGGIIHDTVKATGTIGHDAVKSTGDFVGGTKNITVCGKDLKVPAISYIICSNSVYLLPAGCTVLSAATLGGACAGAIATVSAACAVSIATVEEIARACIKKAMI